MRKSLKKLSMSAATLLAIAPSLVTSGIANADTQNNITVSNGGDEETEGTNDLLLTLTTKNVNDLSDGSKPSDIKVDFSSNYGQPKLNGNVYAVKTSDLSKVTDVASAKKYAAKTLEGGISYTLVADGATISGLNPEDTYSYNDKAVPEKATSFTTDSLIKSSAFIVKDSNLDIQPYFSQNQNGQDIALANGAQANAVSANGISNVKDVLTEALKAVKINDGQNPKDSKAILTTNVADIKSQLMAQKIAVSDDGNFDVPAAGFNIVLTIANNASGKTATVTVPFKGQTDPNSESPQFKVNGDSYTQPRFFVTRASDKDTDKDTATEFTDLNGKKVTFTAVENADSKQNVKITGNGANFKIPGQYTVTLTATNTKGKTSQAVYTLVVLGESSQHVYANGAPNVATYSLEGGQAKKLDTTLKDNQPVTVEGVAKTVNGVSYTQVKTDDGKEYYVQTANLTKKETNSGTKDQQTVRNYKLMHAAYIYNSKGKRVGQSILPSYIQLTTYGNPIKIGDGVYYKVGEDQYVKQGNIFGSHRTFIKNAYIYKRNGKAYTYKTTIKRNGKKVRVTRHNGYKKGEEIITFGAHFKIKGHDMYRINENQYVMVSNLSAPKATSTQSVVVNGKSSDKATDSKASSGAGVTLNDSTTTSSANSK